MKCYRYNNWTDANNLQVLSDEISKKQKVRETILRYIVYDIPGSLPVLQYFSFAFFAFVELLADQERCIVFINVQVAEETEAKINESGVDIIL